ncbi:MAG: SixA phosphatase family protein [Bacteroidia bacterium]|jgi:phosphohistidine phosphatase
MKTVCFIRHAKSSWTDLIRSDFDRMLSKRGKRDLQQMIGRKLWQSYTADCLLYSPAARTKATARYLRENSKAGLQSAAIPDLYMGDANTIIQILRAQDDRCRHIVLVGHNPGIEDLIRSCFPFPYPKFPTLGMAALAWDMDNWADISIQKAQFLWFDYPKNTTV